MLAFARPVWWLLQQHVSFGMWWTAYLLQLIHSSSVCVWRFFLLKCSLILLMQTMHHRKTIMEVLQKISCVKSAVHWTLWCRIVGGGWTRSSVVVRNKMQKCQEWNPIHIQE